VQQDAINKFPMVVNCLRVIISIVCWVRFAGAADFTSQQLEEKNFNQPIVASNTLPTYQKEVLRQLLNEVNDVAHALKLEENLPIIESNLVGKFIAPASFSMRYGGLGSLKTENYTYSASVGHKL